MFKIEFKTDNASFFDPNDTDFNDEARAAETARILQHIAEQVEGGFTSGLVIDSNGNRVGHWGFA